LHEIDVQRVSALLPTSLLFWLAFAAYYFAGPTSDWCIFRRLWSLPFNGVTALLRKHVSNEILLDYLGEVYFYTWAERHAQLTNSPFGAVKDVALLSALVGNLFTLIMAVSVVPILVSLHMGLNTTAVASSIMFMLTMSATIIFLRKQIFTLSSRKLWFITTIHAGRVVGMLLLAVLLWHLLLPSVVLSWWLLLGTTRQLLSRLPFLPNKDIVFAGVASFLVGPGAEITAAIALFSTLVLAAHLVMGLFIAFSNLSGEGNV
jgi:hypothetical protein